VPYEDNVDPMVFALVPNPRAKTVLKDNTDLVRAHPPPSTRLARQSDSLTPLRAHVAQSLFAKQVAWPELNQWFTVIAESEEGAGLVLTKQISSTIAKYHNIVRYIHISDQFPHLT
jgi:hypothetical protein